MFRLYGKFDLGDCDKILRVKSKSGVVEPTPLIDLLKYFGFTAEVLPDEPPICNHIDLKDEFKKAHQ